jgi:hypothetical protein
MQEELHFNLRVPGSNPGCAFGAVAQRQSSRTRSRVLFLQFLSPQVLQGRCIVWLANAGGSTSGPTGFRPLGKNSLLFLSPARGRVWRMPKELCPVEPSDDGANRERRTGVGRSAARCGAQSDELPPQFTWLGNRTSVKCPHHSQGRGEGPRRRYGDHSGEHASVQTGEHASAQTRVSVQ